MRSSLRTVMAAGAVVVAAAVGRGQDGDPFADPTPPAPAAPPETKAVAAPVPPARPALRLRGVAIVAGRPPLALLEVAGGATVVVRTGDAFAVPGAAECRVAEVAAGVVRVGFVGSETTWVVR